MASGALPHETPVARGGAQIGPVRLERAPPHLTRGPGRGYGTPRACRRHATCVEAPLGARRRGPLRVPWGTIGLIRTASACFGQFRPNLVATGLIWHVWSSALILVRRVGVSELGPLTV